MIDGYMKYFVCVHVCEYILSDSYFWFEKSIIYMYRYILCFFHIYIYSYCRTHVKCFDDVL